MAHYAILDENNIVIGVFPGKDEGEDNIDWEEHYSNFLNKTVIRTSYNTNGNTHSQNKTPFRKNYAGIGMTYDEIRDAFIPQKVFDSWTLNEETCLWEAPIPKPIDEKIYRWDEEIINWVEFSPPEPEEVQP